MKKLIITLLTLATVTFSSVGQTNQTSQLFTGNELSLTLGSSYVADKGFNDDYSFNLSVGAQYFLTKNIGVDALVPVYSTKGVSVSEVAFGGLVRVPVINHVAPYLGVGAVYNWQDKTDWNYYAKGGLEVRLVKGWGVFGEGVYRVDTLDNYKNGSTSVQGGLRLVF